MRRLSIMQTKFKPGDNVSFGLLEIGDIVTDGDIRWVKVRSGTVLNIVDRSVEYFVSSNTYFTYTGEVDFQTVVKHRAGISL
jgi:hypothetical protein